MADHDPGTSRVADLIIGALLAGAVLVGLGALLLAPLLMGDW